ncbi:HEAT repeat domain-containing protein [Armatimonas sp.]|uniref:HEAT repeat domain-containing protein n=1 Tax=Armatimonas sp. TaxID=1872638 RepID=UPI003751802D
MNDDSLPRLLEQLREAKPDYAGSLVREAIVVLVGKRAVEPLIHLLDDTNETVATDACVTLGLLRDRRAVAPIAARLDRFGWNGPNALGNLGGSHASDALLRYLDAKSGWKIPTIRMLGFLRERRAIPALIKLLPVDHAHMFATEGIGKLDLGDNAAVSLGKIGKPAGDALVGALTHSDAFVRERAATALVEVKYSKAAPLLLKQLDDDTLPAVAAADALAALKEKRAIPVLLRWLERSRTTPFPKAAVGCLGAIGDPRLFSVLANIADGPDRELASTATYALGGLRCDESFRYLEKCPRDRVLQAYYALGAQKDPRAFALLTERLKFSDNEEAMVLAVVLQKLGDPRAIPVLMKRSAVSRPPLDMDIFPAVAGLGKEGIKMIGALANSKDESCLSDAIFALEVSRSLEALRYLRPLLKHRDSDVVKTAISAMFEILTAHRKTGP